MFSLDPSYVPNPALAPWADVDFTREIVVVAAMGQRPSSGYCIFIDKVYERDDRLEVVVRSVENRKCGGWTVLTSPVDIVRLPKTDRVVFFREIEVESDCYESLLRIR
jgi:PrcB C-terminal